MQEPLLPKEVPIPVVRRNRAEIDLGALRQNLKALRVLAPQQAVLGIVKADAYGHGARWVGPALERAGIDWLGVALVEEGLGLRRLGVTVPVLVLDGSYGGRYDLLIANRLVPIVFDRSQLEGLAAAARRLGQPAQAHLKIDTGMGRLGILPGEVEGFGRAAQELGVELTGVCTHFPNADLADEPMAHRQLEAFAAVRARLAAQGHRPRWVHLANSAASLEIPEGRGTLLRPGLLLYGAFPAPRLSKLMRLQPVLRWLTEVVQLKSVPDGFPVSYGGHFVTRRPSRLAALAVGYADGYRRDLSGKVEVLIGGRRAPVVGMITMDLCVADVTDLPNVSLEDEVVLIGNQGKETLTVEELAAWAGTIPYEILCGISSRVPRVPIS